jgi:hypothetical protein
VRDSNSINCLKFADPQGQSRPEKGLLKSGRAIANFLRPPTQSHFIQYILVSYIRYCNYKRYGFQQDTAVTARCWVPGVLPVKGYASFVVNGVTYSTALQRLRLKLIDGNLAVCY